MTTEHFSPMRWHDGVLELIDQLALPGEEDWIACHHEDEVARAISTMIVRGAPAIGCAAAYGVAIAARRLASASTSDDSFRAEIDTVIDKLAATRPTAVNLFWALDRMKTRLAQSLQECPRADAAKLLEAEAALIQREDLEQCIAIGRHGAPLIPDGATVLTHCNAGALATAGYGTAIGVIRAAFDGGNAIKVLADETRPYLQGARLTAWELFRERIDVTIIPDSAAPFLIARGEVDCAIVGADRIAANGDTANKIGTYSVALAAQAHNIPFFVAAPTSTLDLQTASGQAIPIEERGGDELLSIAGTRIAPRGVPGRYPAFDITPARLISAIITERGILRAPYNSSLASLNL